MAEKPMDVYLNDHMAGAMLGGELADQICERAADTALGDLMMPVAEEIREDRETLDALMDELDVTRNPVKHLGGWMTEKWSRIKFSGAGAGAADHGNFMALETLALGVLGKRSLWVALKTVEDQHEALRRLDIGRLIERADAQHDVIERARVQAASSLLSA